MVPSPGFCKHPIWIFGVLVALSVKEAITRVAPHLLAFDLGEPRLPMWTEGLRLLAFGLLIVRFYLSAAHLFDITHSTQLTPALAAPPPPTAPQNLRDSYKVAEAAETDRLKKAARQFGVDFFAGLLHFGAFAVLSLTLELHPPDKGGTVVSAWAFRWVLLFVLMYDVFWILGRPRPHPREIKFRTFGNLITALAAAVTFWALTEHRHWSPEDAEAPILVGIFLVSAFHISEITMGNQFFSKATLVTVKYIGDKIQGIGRWLSGAGT
jgi:hypothetical protein